MERHERLSEAEFMIMKIVWDEGRPVTAPEIRRQMEERFNRRWAAQTMSTYLKILIQKGHLKTTHVTGRVFTYEAITDARQYQKEDICNLVAEMSQAWGQHEFIKDLAMALHGSDLTKEDIDELRRVLDDMD